MYTLRDTFKNVYSSLVCNSQIKQTNKKTENDPKCPLIYKLIYKLLFIQIIDYYTVVKNEWTVISPDGITEVNFRNIMLNGKTNYR